MKKSNIYNLEWAFLYFGHHPHGRYKLNCHYPDIFNGKKVIGFSPNGRPIGEGGIDLIENYWESVENGFAINGDLDRIMKFWNKRNSMEYNKLADLNKNQVEYARRKREGGMQ